MDLAIKYPIYIVSRGRYKNPLTANLFKRWSIDFKIVVEPFEFDQYCAAVGAEHVLKLPFENEGLGSFPARNWIWAHAIDRGAARHWIFDDNIRHFVRLNKGKRTNCDGRLAISSVEKFTDRFVNVAISGFNYRFFVKKITKKPVSRNVHVYSGLLIKNDMPFRWRMKYNEDIDLCLQVLSNNFCTLLFNAFLIDKVSTTHKMDGGNQTELYLKNAYDRKVVKAKSIESIWPQYVKTVKKFGRPHHSINWQKHFKQPLLKIKKSIS